MFGLSAASRACGRRVSTLHIVRVGRDPAHTQPAASVECRVPNVLAIALCATLRRACPDCARPMADRGGVYTRTLLLDGSQHRSVADRANMTLEVSLIGPIANLIAVPMGLVAMTAGFGGCAVWHVWPWLGSVMNAGSGAVLTALASLVSAMASVPCSSVPIRMLSKWEIAAYYSLLACTSAIGSDAFGRYRFRRAAGRIAKRPAAVVCSVGMLFLLAFRSAPFEVVVLSVGQGDAIFVSAPGSAGILIDAGAAWAGDKHVVPYLARRGVRRLDLLVITHEHADHAGGTGAVANCVGVGGHSWRDRRSSRRQVAPRDSSEPGRCHSGRRSRPGSAEPSAAINCRSARP